ncbi:serine hydrolase [Niveibacterium sp. SC-1]|uniref:D-alanyl-D-alanine carboxypeptidase family protein n=1 Tax=Niveibacterium sp. SC-1 TaxID=3135646 RepID=UPI00311E86A0
MRRPLRRGLVLLGCVAALLSATARAQTLAQTLPMPAVLPRVADAVQVDLDGQPLWSATAHAALRPASLTKILTALLVIERGELDARTIISPRAAKIAGTRIGLRAGERVRVDALLTAALVRSANDACLALAEWHSGSEARFVATMNARARELGLHDSHFDNACGLDAPTHRASAADLARLAQLAMTRPAFAERVRLREGLLVTEGGRRLPYTSTNAMLEFYPGLLGVKTGHTQKAGDCLIVLAERDGHRVLAVLLNARNRWWDATSLLDYTFAQLQAPAGDARAAAR